MAADPLAAKRRQLRDLILANRKAKWRVIQANPLLDLNEVTAAFDRPAREQLEQDIARMDEGSLDMCIEHYSPASIRYVW